MIQWAIIAYSLSTGQPIYQQPAFPPFATKEECEAARETISEPDWKTECRRLGKP